MKRITTYLLIAALALFLPITGPQHRAEASTISQFYPLMSGAPEIWQESGTYVPPVPGKDYLVFCIGGGGGGGSTGTIAGGSGGSGGGSGRVFFNIVTISANQTVTIGSAGAGGVAVGNGSAGGTTSLGALCTVAGGSGGASNAGTAGSGGFGGGGGGAISVQGGIGGAGLDYMGGAGGGVAGGGSAGTQGTSIAGGILPRAAVTTVGGYPNGGDGAAPGFPGGGGDPALLFPWAAGCGRGGTGGYNIGNGQPGTKGCVIIWAFQLRQ